MFLKNNFLYYLYFWFRYLISREKESNAHVIPFFKKLLPGKPSLIFDIGANHGDMSYVFNRLGAKVIALEPDELNFNFLLQRFKYSSSVIPINYAVGDRNETKKFFIVNDGSGLNTLSKKRQSDLNITNSYNVNVTTLDNLIIEYGNPDFIKIDVEGFEINVLNGLNKKVKMLSFEANLPDFKQETIQCINRICTLSSNSRFNYGGDYDLLLKDWISREEIIRIIEETNVSYINIYCKM